MSRSRLRPTQPLRAESDRPPERVMKHVCLHLRVSSSGECTPLAQNSILTRRGRKLACVAKARQKLKLHKSRDTKAPSNWIQISTKGDSSPARAQRCSESAFCPECCRRAGLPPH
ncbi:hypothetical protein EVAR_81331_1 [Eumeta japonica]|uniref:Uncharacterized protein n=1 Tax=Eumeta variegata TaxID=151549 RepID=A0A4C1W2W6_EUMVA|nr:hypothetical protein EVAR_81331_1 [Eumeta japonica]